MKNHGAEFLERIKPIRKEIEEIMKARSMPGEICFDGTKLRKIKERALDYLKMQYGSDEAPYDLDQLYYAGKRQIQEWEAHVEGGKAERLRIVELLKGKYDEVLKIVWEGEE